MNKPSILVFFIASRIFNFCVFISAIVIQQKRSYRRKPRSNIRAIPSKKFPAWRSIATVICLLFISSCVHTDKLTNHEKNIQVDRASLLKSVIYVQRQLLTEVMLEGDIGSQKRTQALLLSYCDLIDRRAIKALNLQHCSTLPQQTKQCSARFHVCVRSYKTLEQDAPLCEARLQRCLQLDDKLLSVNQRSYQR